MNEIFKKPQWIWFYPTAGLGTAFLFTIIPGHPFSIEEWPVSGPFGAFTWGAFVVSLGLSITLVMLALRLWWRSRTRPQPLRSTQRPIHLGRVFGASALFGLLAGLTFAVTAKLDLLQSNPGVALGVAIAAVVLLGTLTQRLDRFGEPTDIDGSEADDDVPAISWRYRLFSFMRMLYKPLLVFLIMYGSLWLSITLGMAEWLGPGPGDVLTLKRPTLIYWSESAYLKQPESRPPDPKTPPHETRFRFLPEGAKVEVKGWVEGGYEVAVKHDPSGLSTGEWGYINANHLGN